MTLEHVVCCFCGLQMRDHDAVQMVLYPTRDPDETQSLYVHRRCLRERLRPEVPLHPGLEDD